MASGFSRTFGRMTRMPGLLVVVHRWLGLLFCLVFLVWFASGIVMVFHRMPEYSAAERLARLPPIDPAAITVAPADALRIADVDAPSRLLLNTLRGRPVYRVLSRGRWTSVYADDGRPVPAVTPSDARAIVATLFGARASHATVIDTITEPDQWAFEIRFGRTGPLHRVALGDAAGTMAYVAQSTGEVVLVTDRASRAWGYAGPVVHWFYFRPLRVRGALWSNLIIYGSLVGCVVALLGLVIGISRFSAARRFKGGTSVTPYVGWLRWHHYAGLIFGVFTFTWTFSGMLSMSPWDWSPGNGPDADQVAAIRGVGVDAGRFAIAPADAVRRLAPRFPAREIEWRQFLGVPYYLAYATSEPADPGRALAPTLVRADTGQLRDAFTRGELLRAARAAMPDTSIVDAAWLTHFDSYYYGRGGDRHLPVLRVRFADADGTWLYLDALDGSLVQREVARSRAERWLYHGFHSLDVPGLYQARGAWYLVVMVLMLGGLALSVTSVMTAWRVVKRVTARRPSRGSVPAAR